MGAAFDVAGPEDRLCAGCGAANKAWRRVCHQCEASLETADDARVHQRLFEDVALEAMLNAESERADPAPPAKAQALSAFIALGEKGRWEAAARDLAAVRDRARAKLVRNRPVVDPPPRPAPSVVTLAPRASAERAEQRAEAPAAKPASVKPRPAPTETPTKPSAAPKAPATQAPPAFVQPPPVSPRRAPAAIAHKRGAGRRALAFTALMGLAIGILAVSSAPFRLGGASDDARQSSLGAGLPPQAAPAQASASRTAATVAAVGEGVSQHPSQHAGASHARTSGHTHWARHGRTDLAPRGHWHSSARSAHHSASRSHAASYRYYPVGRSRPPMSIPYEGEDWGLF